MGLRIDKDMGLRTVKETGIGLIVDKDTDIGLSID